MSTLLHIIEVHLECLLPNVCVCDDPQRKGGNGLGFKPNRVSIDVKGHHSAVGCDEISSHAVTQTRAFAHTLFRSLGGRKGKADVVECMASVDRAAPAGPQKQTALMM